MDDCRKGRDRIEKWRPRRSIIFCSWGAEEYGLLGSIEWVEQYTKNLAARAIAYINVDIALEGNYSLRASASPMLHDVIFSAAKKVPNPDEDDKNHKTVYDKWRATFPLDKNNSNSLPKIPQLGSASDFAPMVEKVGLPSCDLSYTYDSNNDNVAFYPLYHSKYETFKAVDEIMDRGFKRHRATGQVLAEIIRNLADTVVLPLDVINFGSILEQLVKKLDKDYGELLRNHSIDFDALQVVTNLLNTEAKAFAFRVKNVDKNNPLDVRKINDQLMMFERAFIDPHGLPSRPFTRHLIFAKSLKNTYAGSGFPGLADALFEIDKSSDQENRWKVVKKHFSVILFTIESATSTLREVSKFMPKFSKKL